MAINTLIYFAELLLQMLEMLLKIEIFDLANTEQHGLRSLNN